MNRYDLTVRGETVHIEFKRISDSRRLAHHYTNKNPNLFSIKGVVCCTLECPTAFGTKWYQDRYPNNPYCPSGIAFCWRKDVWDMRKGRHESLADALHGMDDDLRAEITEAFTAEEKRRTKVKGPDKQPKTAKPKPRRASLRQVLIEMHDLLKQMAHPVIYSNAALSEQDLEKLLAAERPGRIVMQAVNNMLPRPEYMEQPENIHPVDTTKENA